ncbi:MAG: hypothetical protein J5925_06560, partial [Clostridia bacterium]|nr:hypothetical protein [Clostridia bacterium]
MKKTIVITLCLCALITLVSCNNTYETPARVSEPAPESTVSAQDDVSAEASEASPEVSRAAETFADGWKALDDFCREFHTEIVDILELEYGSGERDFIYWMIDNEIDEWSDAHAPLAGTGAEMRAHAYECYANWKREVLETLDELSGL